MVPMLILDKQLAIERMVAVASRPRVPAAFLRTAPPEAPIAGILVQTSAHSVPQRRLAGVLVLAGSHSEEREALPRDIDAREPLAFVSEPSATDTGMPYLPPILLPELHLLTKTATAPQEPMNLLRSLARLLHAAPRPRGHRDVARRPYAHIDAGRIHAWHTRPVDVS